MSAAHAAQVPASVEAAAHKAVGMFVRILARCGWTRRDIARAFNDASEEIPPEWAMRARRATREITDASHILTVWFTEPAYLDADGKPRPLPLEGTSTSVARLVRSVNRKLDAREVVAYLMRGRAVRRQGKCYVPRTRMLLLRGVEGPDFFRTLRVLTIMLGTFEHNVLPGRAVPGRYERIAENEHFPVSQFPKLEKYIAALGKGNLARVDHYMYRHAKTRRPGEPTVHVVFGMYIAHRRGRADRPADPTGQQGLRRK